MKATTKQWLDYAQTDLRSCQNNLHDDFVTNVVAFHSQQAVEKAFKALLEEKEISVPRVHNLNRLYSLVSHLISETINLSELDALDNVYTSSRYPSDIGLVETGKPTQSESKELFDISMKIYQIIVKAITS